MNDEIDCRPEIGAMHRGPTGSEQIDHYLKCVGHLLSIATRLGLGDDDLAHGEAEERDMLYALHRAIGEMIRSARAATSAVARCELERAYTQAHADQVAARRPETARAG